MNCRSCKYWDTSYAFDEIAFNCHKEGDQIGYCLMASPDTEDQKLFLAIATCNSEGIYGQLVTKADFGCIQYVAK